VFFLLRTNALNLSSAHLFFLVVLLFFASLQNPLSWRPFPLFRAVVFLLVHLYWFFPNSFFFPGQWRFLCHPSLLLSIVELIPCVSFMLRPNPFFLFSPTPPAPFVFTWQKSGQRYSHSYSLTTSNFRFFRLFVYCTTIDDLNTTLTFFANISSQFPGPFGFDSP